MSQAGALKVVDRQAEQTTETQSHGVLIAFLRVSVTPWLRLSLWGKKTINHDFVKQYVHAPNPVNKNLPIEIWRFL
jgi:hypothetical protein